MTMAASRSRVNLARFQNTFRSLFFLVGLVLGILLVTGTIQNSLPTMVAAGALVFLGCSPLFTTIAVNAVWYSIGIVVTIVGFVLAFVIKFFPLLLLLVAASGFVLHKDWFDQPFLAMAVEGGSALVWATRAVKVLRTHAKTLKIQMRTANIQQWQQDDSEKTGVLIGFVATRSQYNVFRAMANTSGIWFGKATYSPAGWDIWHYTLMAVPLIESRLPPANEES